MDHFFLKSRSIKGNYADIFLKMGNITTAFCKAHSSYVYIYSAYSQKSNTIKNTQESFSKQTLISISILLIFQIYKSAFQGILFNKALKTAWLMTVKVYLNFNIKFLFFLVYIFHSEQICWVITSKE